MIIVADSGSTKTDWVVLAEKSDEVASFASIGFNPIYHSSELIQKTVAHAFLQENVEKAEVSKIFYYGTAIWDKDKAAIVERGLRGVFPQAHIEVKHDLLGAARATCGDEPGIACIMGTGSNTCLYDGVQITDNVTNLGYFIGDEGSGAHLGKKLVRAYFYRELPPDLREALEQVVPGGKSEFLENIYGEGASPNVYLASLTRFIGEYQDHFFIHRLLYRSFAEFIDRHVRKYPGHLSLPVHFIGSVAFHFQDFLKTILFERRMQPGRFIKKPIDTLVNYHRKNR